MATWNASRLVCARGDQQEWGDNFEETSSPVAELTSVRLFLTLSAMMKLKIRQCDVPTAYVRAKLDRPLHMHQVQGFKDPEAPTKVWLLRKALNGLIKPGSRGTW